MTLDEIGHLREIVEQYAYHDGQEGAFRRPSGQVANKAREEGFGPIEYDSGRSYDLGRVSSHGSGTISGLFLGWAEDCGDMLRISGESSFKCTDDFVDPVDLDIEVGGIPYHISAELTASFSVKMLKDRKRSIYFDPRRPR